jgi:hypothetical protein
MKIKRFKLFKVREVIQAMGKANTFKFSYACAKNLRLVNREIEDMQKTLEPDEGMKGFEADRIALCQEFSKKEGGNPIITGNRFEIDETKMYEFNTAMETLREVYKDVLELNDKKSKTYGEALQEEVDLNFHIVRLEDLPPETKPDELETILDWITADERLPS